MAIHNQNYIRYEGPLRQSHMAWTIAWSELRMYWSFRKTKFILIFLWLMPLITGVLVFVEYTLYTSSLQEMGVFKTPGVERVMVFLQLQLYSLGVLFAASGCGVIANDLRFKTFQLYFSKPLTKSDYVLGKFLGLFLLGSLITTLPALLLTALRMVFFARAPYFGELAYVMSIALILVTFATAIMSIILMGLSSLAKNARYVVLLWLGFLIVPQIVGAIIGVMNNSSDMANMFHLTGNIWLMGLIFLQEASLDVPKFIPFVATAACTLAGFGAIRWRIGRLEGVA